MFSSACCFTEFKARIDLVPRSHNYINVINKLGCILLLESCGTMVKLNNACIINFNYTVLVYGPFLTYEWAILDVAVGRFGPGYGPFLPFAWAVFALCVGRFGSWAVLV